MCPICNGTGRETRLDGQSEPCRCGAPDAFAFWGSEFVYALAAVWFLLVIVTCPGGGC